jgi:hypothetical protein
MANLAQDIKNISVGTKHGKPFRACRSNASWIDERYTRETTGMLAWRLTGSTGRYSRRISLSATIEHF